ncbi:MAG TPA: mechanosensitive ion channel domain-containing protein [Stellaceae bacterium]|nr:mechanosensitive ion channel domain-containing protein [Stellaceae bacterium]
MDIAWTWAAAFLPRLIAAVLILIVGSIIARWLSRAIFNVTGRTAHIDTTVRPILAAIVRYSILILVFIAALSQIGVQTASLFAVLGAAGIAIGLALQGTLSNIAAGLMLLWLRPFRVGDFIEVNGMSGTVREIGLFVCHLETFDGIFLFAPNATIWNQALRNHTRNAGRLVSVDITVPAKADIERARDILLAMAKRDQRVLKTPQPRVFIESLTGGGLMLNLRVWASHENIGELQRVIIEETKRELEAAAIETLQPQQVVRVIPPDSDPSRLLSPAQPYID